MKEAQWLAGNDLERMLRYLGDRADERKLRLFACACCRRIEDCIRDPRSRKAVQTAEQFADGRVGGKARSAAESAALSATRKAETAYWASLEDADWVAWRAAAAAAWAVAVDGEWALETAGEAADVRAGPWRPAAVLQAEKEAQCNLARDIFGNPLRPVAPDSSQARWRSGTVGKLAQAIYEERRFGDLPILADALVEAGCQNEAILAHCRASGEHARGCWVVDLLLGH